MKLLYNPRALQEDNSNQKRSKNFAIPHLEPQSFYLCRSDTEKPFYICRVKSVCVQNKIPGARVQWFIPETEDGDYLRGSYIPEIRHCQGRRYTLTFPNAHKFCYTCNHTHRIDEYPFEEQESFQYLLKVSVTWTNNGRKYKHAHIYTLLHEIPA